MTRLRWTLLGVGATAALALASACSPVYVLRAGIAEAKILAGRRPLPEVILDPDTDEDTRGKLTLAREARRFAMDSLGMDVGDSYTSYTRLERDTLAMVLSAAYRDRLAARTWWFPIVGHVPYRGFFDFEAAEEERRNLENEGYDTYLRPTSAFSTLGWFSDPILSSFLRYDSVDFIETLLHEMSHAHLFVPGQVTFNESFAQFVGRTASIRFFCLRSGGGPDTVLCRRARDRWLDEQEFSRFIDRLVDDLQGVYADDGIGLEQKIRRRDRIFEHARREFVDQVQPRFRSFTYGGFLAQPLNNATLLSRMRYYHRLPDFQAYLDERDGDLVRVLRELAEAAPESADPFSLLPRTATPDALGAVDRQRPGAGADIP